MPERPHSPEEGAMQALIAADFKMQTAYEAGGGRTSKQMSTLTRRLEDSGPASPFSVAAYDSVLDLDSEVSRTADAVAEEPGHGDGSGGAGEANNEGGGDHGENGGHRKDDGNGEGER
ncbi:hypothetical protein EJ03DRAFT_373327 [Teratosphaeria nubilosa]|uniref:Uncharacterized protein n=1 Tax=Teratosphaeria nubilosa TaxID=161662 RepID=A0A6G1LDN0_9PEZI|nr:hypothetical protein EJ03DRAFT_373327 [Teratosphaeria nubilosa]